MSENQDKTCENYDETIPQAVWSDKEATTSSTHENNNIRERELESELTYGASDDETEQASTQETKSLQSPAPSFFTNASKNKKNSRSRTAKATAKCERNLRSSSGQRRKRSDEEVAANKKSKPHLAESITMMPSKSESYVSVGSQPDLEMSLDGNILEECMDRIIEKYVIKTNVTLSEINNKIDNLQQNVSQSMDNLTSRICIIENDHKKQMTENAEKILTNENNIIAVTERVSALETALENEKKENERKAMIIDNLDQAARNKNMFVAGLTDAQATKEGFLQFAQETLKVIPDTNDIKAIFRIPSEKERLYKILFRNHESRDKYYMARKLLRAQTTIWFRDDLTRRREQLAKQLRVMAKGGIIQRAWTDHGTILVIRNGESKPTRVNKIDDIPI